MNYSLDRYRMTSNSIISAEFATVFVRLTLNL